MEVVVADDLCKGCGICVELCPKKVLKSSETLTKRGFYPPEKIAGKKCNGCRLCELTCPDLAIWVIEDEK